MSNSLKPVKSWKLSDDKRETYYRAVKPEVQKMYSSDDALMLEIKNRHDGPWDELE